MYQIVVKLTYRYGVLVTWAVTNKSLQFPGASYLNCHNYGQIHISRPHRYSHSIVTGYEQPFKDNDDQNGRSQNRGRKH